MAAGPPACLLTGICGVVEWEGGVGVGRQRLPRRLRLEAPHRRSASLPAKERERWNGGGGGRESVCECGLVEGGSRRGECGRVRSLRWEAALREKRGGSRIRWVRTKHRAAAVRCYCI